MKRSTWILVWSLAAGAPAHATDWHLYPPDCAGGAATVEIRCGSVGRYLVGLQTPPPPTTCPNSQTRQGSGGGNVLETYPPAQGTAQAFPVRASRLGEEPAQLASTGKKGPGLKAVVGPGPSLRRLFVVDWDNWHGDSTAYLAGQVAGPDVTATLIPLQRPALAPLGDEVGDFHVLAAVCAIAEAVAQGDVLRPDVVNMSFGRRAHSEDPSSAAECDLPSAPHTVACEIARVVARLAQQGTHFVSAAGNHGAPLFPGTLEEVISAGMLDLTRFFDGGSVVPAWETPPGAEALIPGNSLCLGSWAAPAGSSYSSALLAGWSDRVFRSPTVRAALNEGTWAPVWNTSKQCWSLGRVVPGQNPKVSPWCNATISAIFGELSGSSAACWNAETEPTVTALAQAPTSPMEDLDPLDAHIFFGAHPTPESDPCVPCSGSLKINGFTRDLWINVSQSQPLPQGIHLDEVALRIDDQYRVLDLLPEDLLQMERGALAEIIVPGVGPLVEPDVSTSLWYRLREGENTACSDRELCFWSSTPLLIDK